MILAPPKTTSHPMHDTFIALKNNQPLPDDMCLLEAYYFIKAHKLVAYKHFIAYWNDGRSKQILRDILNAYYPPLEYCHTMEEGFVDLTVYVAAAKEVFGTLITAVLTNEESDSILHSYHILIPTGNLRVIFLNNKHLKA